MLFERLSTDVFVKVLEYIDLSSVYHFSLCNKEMNELVNTTEHTWKVLYHQLCGEYNEDGDSPCSWKQRLREALQWSFAPCISERGEYKLSNRNRTLHYSDANWRTFSIGKCFTLKEHCGKTIHFEIVLDRFPDSPCNFYSVIIGAHWNLRDPLVFWEPHWNESEGPSRILGYSVNDEIGFACGNRFVFRDAQEISTQGATGCYTWPGIMIKSGDVISVKLMIEKTGKSFDIDFFVNGERVVLNDDSVQVRIAAKTLQPCVSIIHNCGLTIKKFRMGQS